MENFHVKTQKSTDFAHTFSKNYSFFLYFLIKIILFTLKIYSYGPKIEFKPFCTMKDAKEFRKNQFSSNIFTFLIVTHQNFEDNLRILANFGKFSRKNSKIYLFRPYVFKKVVFFFFVYLMKIIFFTLKIYLFAPKLVSKHFLQQKMQKVS